MNPSKKRWPSFHQLVPVVSLVLTIGLSGVACAQVARMEIIPFASVTLTDQEFLAGREDGKPVTVAGELRLPRAGNEKFPLVILLHGSGGIAGFLTDWWPTRMRIWSPRKWTIKSARNTHFSAGMFRRI